jgi:hypothetical protein
MFQQHEAIDYHAPDIITHLDTCNKYCNWTKASPLQTHQFADYSCKLHMARILPAPGAAEHLFWQHQTNGFTRQTIYEQ